VETTSPVETCARGFSGKFIRDLRLSKGLQGVVRAAVVSVMRDEATKVRVMVLRASRLTTLESSPSCARFGNAGLQHEGKRSQYGVLSTLSSASDGPAFVPASYIAVTTPADIRY